MVAIATVLVGLGWVGYVVMHDLPVLQTRLRRVDMSNETVTLS